MTLFMFIDEIDYKTRMVAMLETPTEIEQAYQLCEEVFVQPDTFLWGVQSRKIYWTVDIGI